MSSYTNLFDNGTNVSASTPHTVHVVQHPCTLLHQDRKHVAELSSTIRVRWRRRTIRRECADRQRFWNAMVIDPFKDHICAVCWEQDQSQTCIRLPFSKKLLLPLILNKPPATAARDFLPLLNLHVEADGSTTVIVCMCCYRALQESKIPREAVVSIRYRKYQRLQTTCNVYSSYIRVWEQSVSIYLREILLPQLYTLGYMHVFLHSVDYET